eukprot:263439-Heterocapsa_arctica.AAC.1
MDGRDNTPKGICCVFASLWPAMCSRSAMACCRAPLFGTRSHSCVQVQLFLLVLREGGQALPAPETRDRGFDPPGS